MKNNTTVLWCKKGLIVDTAGEVSLEGVSMKQISSDMDKRSPNRHTRMAY